jgi:XapX domain-containing protein
MISALLGLILGFLIGAGCRWFDLPLPAPPRIVGALLVVAMTVGFLGADLALGQWGVAS